MFIMSQNKSSLFNIDQISCIYICKEEKTGPGEFVTDPLTMVNTYKITTHTDYIIKSLNDEFEFGRYSTEDRAKQVLENLANAYTRVYIYIMPQK